MNRWMYVAADARACIADTRALVLKHQLVWHAMPPNTRPTLGDRLLLTFKEHSGELSALAILEIDDAARRLGTQLDRVSKRNRSYGEAVWDTVWDEFVAARRGRGGSGYSANAERRVLVVKVVDALDEMWQRHDDLFTGPPNTRFRVKIPGSDGAEVLTGLSADVVFEGPLAPFLKTGMQTA